MPDPLFTRFTPPWARTSASTWPALLIGLVFAVLALTAGPVAAQAQDTEATLQGIRQRIDESQKALRGDIADADLQRLRQTALAAQTEASDIAETLVPQVTSLQARLAELGTATPGAREDADVARQRGQIERSQATLDAQLKLARLLAVESGQLAEQTWTLRRSQFQARLGERTTSILSVSFWSELRAEAPRDAARLAALGRELVTAAGATPWWAWAAALLAAVGLWYLRAAAERGAVALIIARLPSGRVRRSFYAVAVVALWTALFGAYAELLAGVLDWNHTLAPATMALLTSVSAMVWFAGYLAGLLSALVCAGRPSWRLAPLPDVVARHLRRLPLLLALVSIVTRVAERLAPLVDASLAMTIAVNGFVALALALTLGIGLVRGERLWRREVGAAAGAGTGAAGASDGAPASPPAWLAVIASIAWLVLVGSFLSLLAGYVAFGSFAVKQVVWTALVIGSAYLLAAVIDDALMTWLAARDMAGDGPRGSAEAPRGAAGAALPALAARARDQAAVLLSGLLRLVLVVVALMLVAAPFGEGPAELIRRTAQWQEGLSIGEIEVRPGALLQAALVLVLGMLAVRVLRGWLSERYLPTTTLDPGMRVSATTLFGYAGVVTAVSLAMSAVGIGLERVAWVASALSVGIGFGLQAVVQNFVSGLILLAERPVKVGDWVSLGGVEGDIRRINVRATEIQMGDRSTVIVPNSEFITKVVRNVTLSDPLGLVQLKLPVPLGSDVERVRDLMLAAFDANPQVLATPAPNVLLDGVDHGFLQFNATGFVNSPRLVGGVRSDLLFDVLQRLASAGIPLSSPPTMVLGAAAPALPAAPPMAASAPAVGPGAGGE